MLSQASHGITPLDKSQNRQAGGFPITDPPAMSRGKRLQIVGLCVLAHSLAGCSPPVPSPAPYVAGPLIRYVDPMIGTAGRGFDIGSAYPGPAMPFGMIHPGPDTSLNGVAQDVDHCSGYNYADNEIIGFSHTRLHGTGATDYGYVLLMPLAELNESMLLGTGYRSGFSHDTEVASPGYYAVTLNNGDIRVELTSAERAALHRYSYRDPSSRYLLIDPAYSIGEAGRIESSSATLHEDGIITGHVHHFGPMFAASGGTQAYFALAPDTQAIETWTFSDGSLMSGREARGKDVGLVLRFAQGDKPVKVRIGISFVSEELARANLDAEVPAWNFEALRTAAESRWEEVLGRVRIAGGSEAQRIVFYTALYHAFLMPHLFSESDGSYRGIDKQVHQAEGFRYYSDLSVWDTFRNHQGLMALIAPERARDFAKSLMAMASQGNSVPRWALGTASAKIMNGDPAACFIAETAFKGVARFDLQEAYALLSAQADGPPQEGALGPGRENIEDYLALGYVPERASTTLEYAYADWALANLAEGLGHEADARRYRARSQNFRKSYDAERALFRPRKRDGTFVDPLDALAFFGQGAYREGTATQYRWYVPHDADALLEIMGEERALLELSRLFAFSAQAGNHIERAAGDPAERHYWHGNEPDLHAAYLFNALGRPHVAQHWVHAILQSQYDTTPAGLVGNDDSGTLSAWYLWSALGLYPIAGGDQYWLGTPLFERILVRRAAGDIEISAPGLSLTRRFTSRALLDAKTVGPRLSHRLLHHGAKLTFELTGAPDHRPSDVEVGPAPPRPAPLPSGPCSNVPPACCPVTTPLATLDACITQDEAGAPRCGVDTSLLGAVGLSFEEPCQMRDQPATDGKHGCPSRMFGLEGSQPVELAGCCRAETKTCGVELDSAKVDFLDDAIALGLGCVSSSPLLPEGEMAAACGG